MTEISAESDKQIRKSQHGRSVYSTVRPKENKQLVTVSEGEEELPEDNVFKEDLVERFTILEQYYEDKDEEPPLGDMLVEDLRFEERSKISKSRKQKDGNPSSIQTQENPDHKILENMSEENRLLTDKIPIKSEDEKTVCSPSDANEAMRRKENKRSVTVPDIEEELPVDMLEEKLKLGERNKILEQRRPELIRLKDEELRDLRTELKQKEETYSATIKRFEKQIKNFQAKHEGKGREKKLENDNKELKDENQKFNKELKELEKENNMVKYEKTILEEGVKKTKELEDEIARLKEGVKKTKELEDEIARLKEDFRDVHEAFRIESLSDIKKIEKLEKECEKLRKKVRELEGEKERSEEDNL